MGVEKVISGGQSGADTAALIVASSLGITTGGYAPKGWMTEDGPAPWLADYGLIEADRVEYAYRTGLNVEHSDGTILFGKMNSPGAQCVQSMCDRKSMNKPLFCVSDVVLAQCMTEPGYLSYYVSWVHRWIGEWNVKVLNVAGNRASVHPEIGEQVSRFLMELLG